jgi:prepilin-type N-terminal cleavage/methylation domain-containing protein
MLKLNQDRLQSGLGRSAFTLIEIIVAMTIIAVIAAVAIPTLKGLNEDEKVRAPIMALAEMVQQVRDRAIRERRPYEIILESGGLHAIPGNRSFSKRDEFLEYLELLRKPPVITGFERTSSEIIRMEKNDPASSAGNPRQPDPASAMGGALPQPKAPEMPWTQTIAMEGTMRCGVLMWGDGEWDDLNGERIRRWVFQANGMASPIQIRIQTAMMDLEATFDALTGEMIRERSRPHSGAAQQ